MAAKVLSNGNGEQRPVKRGRWIRRLGLGVVALASAFLTLVGAITILRAWYDNTIGYKASMYDRLRRLAPETQVEYFTEVLGAPQFKNPSEVLDQYIFVSDYYYVQAVTNKDGKVVFYSVTTRRDDFHPSIPHDRDRREARSGPLLGVRLGVTRFSDIDPEPLCNPASIAAFQDNISIAYAELFYCRDRSSSSSYVFSVVETGHLEVKGSPALWKLSSEKQFRELIVSGWFLRDEGIHQEPFRRDDKFNGMLKNPLIQQARSDLVINSYAVTAMGYNPKALLDGRYIFGPLEGQVQPLRGIKS